MNALTQVDASAGTPLWERVMTWSAFGGVLTFGLYQVAATLAWLVLVAIVVAAYWVERRHRGSRRRAGLTALLIVMGSLATVVVVSAFVGALFGF